MRSGTAWRCALIVAMTLIATDLADRPDSTSSISDPSAVVSALTTPSRTPQVALRRDASMRGGAYQPNLGRGLYLLALIVLVCCARRASWTTRHAELALVASLDRRRHAIALRAPPAVRFS
jgi:hypothetical protein